MSTAVNIKLNVRKYEYKIIWPMVLSGFLIFSGAGLGIFFISKGYVAKATFISTLIFFLFGFIGISPTAHRLFSHRSFKVTYGLKVFMVFCQQVSGLMSTITWCRVHRTHHKFTDTDKDPTNINRGLFFSFGGWLLVTPTSECQIELDKIHMNDLLSDKLLTFQYRYYAALFTIITLGIPTIIPYYYWNESIYVAFGMNMLRYTGNVLQIFIGNSLLHWNGRKPYDATNTAIDNIFYNILTLGEGFHNFHHAFPFDYRSNEIPQFWHITSLSTIFIDACVALGLAYDLKKASPGMIGRRIARTGDGSHSLSKDDSFKKPIWGYGDFDMDVDDKKELERSAEIGNVNDIIKNIKIVFRTKQS